jgi:hypothetical protein
MQLNVFVFPLNFEEFEGSELRSIQKDIIFSSVDVSPWGKGQELCLTGSCKGEEENEIT